MKNTVIEKHKIIIPDSKFKLNIPITIATKKRLADKQAVFFAKSLKGCVILNFQGPFKSMFPILTQKITVSKFKGRYRPRLRYRVIIPEGIRLLCPFLKQRKISIVDRGQYLELWPADKGGFND